ncbi:MAG: insulinase family protein [Planctomycetes bacterium]|nr:insulinase family protein [Planctomycetota bacterium]
MSDTVVEGAGAVRRDGAFEIVRDPVLGEEVWTATTGRGLALRVAPTGRFRESVAVVSVGYGSTDLGFEVDGHRHLSPEGVAHYLEHKLFEDEDLHVFERFAQRGAQVNATTGFTRTNYFFQATSQFEANLDDLLRLVARAHLTPENVEKERGIIAQELRMYEDSPEYRGFFELLRLFYREHPVRHPVGGTVDSIAAIDVDELRACHAAFYRTGNAVLSVAGPVDPHAVLAQAESCELPAGDAVPSVFPADLDPPERTAGEVRMEVARPRLLLGFKDRALLDDPAAHARRELVTRILLDRQLGPSSDLRERLHREGLIDDSLSVSYMGERTFGFTVAVCETDRPDVVAPVLREALQSWLAIDAADLERVRRKVLGQYVRSFDSVRSLAFGHAEDALEGLAPFGTLARLASIGVDDVRDRQREHCIDSAFAQVVVRGG